MNQKTPAAPDRAVVFAPFFSTKVATNRPRVIALALAELMPVDVVTTDFDHAEKRHVEIAACEPFAEVVQLKTDPYHNNVSVARLWSHLLFGLRAAAHFRRYRHRYSVVYTTVPLNVLSWLVFRQAEGKTKIVDVVDIWPDVLPFSKLLRRLGAPMFAAWKWFFRSAVAKADAVLAVSDEFLEEARRFASPSAKMKRFYIGHERLLSAAPKQPVFTIAYVGNLGRLYDFETLLDVLSTDELRATAQLFVIGSGDRQEWLIAELERRNIRYRFFGPVFGKDRLAGILRSCHVGFNGYANTTAAFSYKANTYFAAGLPIVNSMGGDLQRLVAERGLGENYRAGDRRQLSECLLRLQANGTAAMSANCANFFARELDLADLQSSVKLFLRIILPEKSTRSSALRVSVARPQT